MQTIQIAIHTWTLCNRTGREPSLFQLTRATTGSREPLLGATTKSRNRTSSPAICCGGIQGTNLIKKTVKGMLIRAWTPELDRNNTHLLVRRGAVWIARQGLSLSLVWRAWEIINPRKPRPSTTISLDSYQLQSQRKSSRPRSQVPVSTQLSHLRG